MDRDTFGQHVAVQLVDRLVHILQHFRRVLSAQHLHDALDTVRIVALLVGESEHAFALQIAVFELTDVIEVDRHAVDRLYDDIAEVLEPLDQPDAPDHVTQIAARDDTAAGVDVVLFDLLGDVRQRDAVLLHLARIDFDLVLCGDAAVIAHVRDAGHLFQARDHHPFVQVGQLAQVVRLTLEDIPENFTGRRRERIESRNGMVRQFDIGKALLHPLPGPVIVHAVVKHQHDRRKAERVLAPHHVQSRQAVHRAFDRDADLLLDLLGSQTRNLRNDLHGHVGNVGIGIDGQSPPRKITQHAQHAEQYEHQRPPMYRRMNQFFHGQRASSR